MSCYCCGEAESTSGCVRGPRCNCLSTRTCDLCTKCIAHHHRNCTPELRGMAEKIGLEAMLAIAKMREDFDIHI